MENKIKLWLENWMTNSPLINIVFPDKVSYINKEAKVGEFIARMKNWKCNNLKEYLPDDIIDKIDSITIPLSNIEDKIVWKFSDRDFFFETGKWANKYID